VSESSPLAHSPTLVQTGDAAASDDDDLAAGTQVGEYVVERFLGAGAMGEVYAGVHPVIGKKVAIKVLKRAVGASKDGAERFKREARAVNTVAHPNVIDVFSFGRLEDGRLYLVMDLVEGRSLRKALTAGPLEIPVVLTVLDQIAEALDAAHKRGVVHRDLKPDNVMLSGEPDSPKVFVLDFGLAKLLTPEGVAPASMLTGQGTWLGTPSYMAPEQWSADGAVPASDRYSLGVIAFELLAGAVPFEAQSLPQMMEQHFRAKVPALSQRGAVSAPAAFDPILARAMAKDPDARFPSSKAMVDALRAAAGSQKRSRPPGAAPSKSLVFAGIAGVGVLGLGIAAVAYGLRAPEHAPKPQASERPPAAPGKVRIDLDTVPRGAQIHRGTQTMRTPTTLEVNAGETVDFDLTKPGYVSVHHALTATDGLTVPPFQLVAIEGFQGVWVLPSGELRAFSRVGGRVEVFKLATVDGAREFFRAYELVDAPAGASFSSTETLHEPGRPEDPTCYVPYTTEYHYEPGTDALTVRREKIVTTIVGNQCVRKSAALGEPELLTRADRGGTQDERESQAPVGIPRKTQALEDAKRKKLVADKINANTSNAPTKSVSKNGKAAPPTKPKEPPPEQTSANNAPPQFQDFGAKESGPSYGKKPSSSKKAADNQFDDEPTQAQAPPQQQAPQKAPQQVQQPVLKPKK
jgi:serine/threonine-protein kinase